MNFQKLIEDRKRFFWLLHFSGWLGFALVHYIGSFMNDMRDIYVFIIISNAWFGALLTLPLRYVYQRIWDMAPWKLILAILSASYVVGSIWVVMQNFTYWEFYKFGYRPDAWYWYFRNSLGGFYIVLCWSGLYFGIKYYQMLQKEKQKALKASSMANEAQLKMLRYQLNPHFLFNTLNAISTLILCEENKTANGMVAKLSDFLRYSLHTDPIKKVQLKQEIQALTLYLEIEKIRFEENLTVIWSVSKEANNALVPSLLLQPLIENAIKYGIAAKTDGGTINIVAKTFGNDLLLEVSDDGPGLTATNTSSTNKGEGVGIANIKDRLQTLYDDYSFSLSANEPNGLKVNIRIPLEFDSE
ncbi:histidine kinase [Psychrosphaera sp. F3M07]|uniref:sensor histidine kinase n=1 Tax=Psychrosphaera sp. F3M07 TaxID=2841560 RepID=UPI001C091C62|nr:histidine kinase [Psychrosphaera sp. F3M07]MBU2916475.1 histidine kinase [Psychrosphaera sp. F3M07]